LEKNNIYKGFRFREVKNGKNFSNIKLGGQIFARCHIGARKLYKNRFKSKIKNPVLSRVFNFGTIFEYHLQGGQCLNYKERR